MPALRNLSFNLPAGEALGVIGPSGSGKSTLARALVGVWPAVTGTMRLDGSDVYQWDKTELGPHVGYLPQEVELFSGTISENIARFGEVNAEQVIQAAQRAGVHDLIQHFPQGYDTPLGDGGAGLSGGQKQRIGLARALYGDPSFVVLDEPNSNLDEAGEQALVSAIADLRQRGKTLVLITHRAQHHRHHTKTVAAQRRHSPDVWTHRPGLGRTDQSPRNRNGRPTARPVRSKPLRWPPGLVGRQLAPRADLPRSRPADARPLLLHAPRTTPK